MARVSIYLNFAGKTEAAFNFYKSVFQTELEGEGFRRFGDMPTMEGQPPISETLKNQILHCGIQIMGGFFLMGSDAPEEMGFKVNQGNNVYINLEPDTRTETDRLFAALSEGGVIEQELKEMFWGDYFGSCIDKFGILWMFSCSNKE